MPGLFFYGPGPSLAKSGSVIGILAGLRTQKSPPLATPSGLQSVASSRCLGELSSLCLWAAGAAKTPIPSSSSSSVGFWVVAHGVYNGLRLQIPAPRPQLAVSARWVRLQELLRGHRRRQEDGNASGYLHCFSHPALCFGLRNGPGFCLGFRSPEPRDSFFGSGMGWRDGWQSLERVLDGSGRYGKRDSLTWWENFELFNCCVNTFIYSSSCSQVHAGMVSLS